VTGTRAPISERLNRRLEVNPNGCLEWTGGTTKDGYGLIRVESKVRYTHRVAWTLKRGPIPPGIKVLHHCDNPPCCETEPTEGYPDGHLFLGTQFDNMADMVAKGRQVNWEAAKTHCPQKHPYNEENTYVDKGGARHCKACQSSRQASRHVHRPAHHRVVLPPRPLKPFHLVNGFVRAREEVVGGITYLTKVI